MLARTYSLKDQKIIDTLFSYAVPATHSRFFVLKLRHNTHLKPRFAISLGKKLDKRASQRNYLRRVTSELIRTLLLEHIKQWGVDILLIGKPALVHASFEDIKQDLLQLFSRLQSHHT